jgi:CheY-like chemotaxis protein
MSRILLVDDEDAFLYATQKSLRSAGFQVLAAPTSFDALETLERADEPVDLLLTDLIMPNGVNGFALARMARLRRQNIKVIYVTGYDVPTVEASGKVLRKPITETELIDEIRATLAA